MKGYKKQSKVKEAPSTGIQGMMNKKFWGKRSLKPKGKALKKAKIEKELATEEED